MAHSAKINVNGVLTDVTEFDNPAQSIDDAVNVLGAPTTPQAALSALGAGVRPNLLDNAYFVGGGSQQGGGQMPINQEGQTSYTGAGGFMDRWKGNGIYASAEINSDSVTFSGSGGTGYVNQVVKDSQSLYGKTVTISALTDDFGLLSATGVALSDPVTQNTPILSCNFSTGQSFHLYKYSDGNFVFAIQNTNGLSTKYIAAKIEEGEGQTLAYQNSTGAWRRLPQPEDGDYAGQLTRCKWYLNRLAYAGGAGLNVAQSYISGSSGTVYFPVPLDCPMRPGNPTIVSYTRMDIYSQSTGVVSDAVITAVNQGNCLVFQAVKSGLSGSGFILTLNNVLVSNEL